MSVSQVPPPQTVSLPSPGDLVAESYRVLAHLGQGARGVVYRAVEIRTNREVAIKFLHPQVAKVDSYLTRFLREIEIATRFTHPSIIRVYNTGRTPEGLHFIVMELLQGRDLLEVIDASGPMPSEKVLHVAEQLLDGLAEAHSQDIVHRDIKPANVFIARNRRGEDRVKLLDFGIARIDDPSLTRLTASGTVNGTPAYMPPEVFVLEDVPGNKGADVYATGLMLLEMLCGRRVVPKCRLDQLVLFHIGTPIVLPEAVANTALGHVICRATMKHPEDRYADAEEMLAALRQAANSTPPFQLSPEQVPPPPSPTTSHAVFEALGKATTDAQRLAVLRQPPQHRVLSPASAPRLSASPGREVSLQPPQQLGPPPTTPPEQAPVVSAQEQAPRLSKREIHVLLIALFVLATVVVALTMFVLYVAIF